MRVTSFTDVAFESDARGYDDKAPLETVSPTRCRQRRDKMRANMQVIGMVIVPRQSMLFPARKRDGDLLANRASKRFL